MAKQVRSGVMSDEAAGMAAEALTNRIAVFDAALALLENAETDSDSIDPLIFDNAQAMADECEGPEQLRRIRLLLVEAKDALEAAA